MKAYRLWDPAKRKIFWARDVIFDESKFPARQVRDAKFNHLAKEIATNHVDQANEDLLSDQDELTEWSTFKEYSPFDIKNSNNNFNDHSQVPLSVINTSINGQPTTSNSLSHLPAGTSTSDTTSANSFLEVTGADPSEDKTGSDSGSHLEEPHFHSLPSSTSPTSNADILADPVTSSNRNKTPETSNDRLRTLQSRKPMAIPKPPIVQSTAAQ
ncbi:hypothetical protein HK102_013784, partial [Quaeritorhiza haematococci]